MRSHRATLLKVVAVLGLLFGLMGVLSATPAAAQQPISCQYIFNADGSVDVVQAVPDLATCANLFATSGPDGCQVTDSNGDGIPESVGPGGSACVFQGGGPGSVCQIKDEMPPDGVIDLVQGECSAPLPTETPIVPTETPIVPTETPIVPTETPIVPTETPIVPTETPIVPTETPIVPTETPIVPTETPGTQTPTTTPGTHTPTTTPETPGTATETPGTATKTPAGGGKAKPDSTVEALPSTGHGTDDTGSGAGFALILGAMSALLFVGGVAWQRRNA